MKYFIVADVHSFYELMIEALNEAGFDKTNKEHIFVSLGDLLDRGNSPLQCLEFVNNLPRKILIRGNHEDLIEEAIERKNFLNHDYHNGTVQTIIDLVSEFTNKINSVDDVFNYMKQHKAYETYIHSLVDYYEDEKNIFVHGWIPCASYIGENGTQFMPVNDWHSGSWSNARWINGMQAWKDGITVKDKTIYCGHWHTSWGHCKINHTSPEWDNKYSTNPAHRKAYFGPFIKDGIVALDACTAYSHKVNCYVVDIPKSEEAKWQ